MKRITVLILLPVMATVILRAASPVRRTFISGGFEREYLVYTPQKVHGKPAGLIAGLHGFNGSMQDFFDAYAIYQVADSLNYMIVAPQALPEQDRGVISLAALLGSLSGDRIRLDAAWGCGLKVKAASRWLTLLDLELNKQVDDVAFISQLIERTVAEYALPVENVFLVGTSMGGYMAYQYALRQPSELAGIISIVGSMGLNIKGMGNGAKIPLCDFHSLTDEVVPYTGSFDAEGGISISLARPKADVLRYWVETNGAGEPTTETVNYYPSTGNITVEKITWPHPRYEVIHYRMNNAGHSYFLRKENGDCMDYTEEIGKFITAHAQPQSGAAQDANRPDGWCYPNPAYHTLYFAAPLTGHASICSPDGKTLRTQSLSGAGQLDISFLPAGLYILNVRTDSGILTARFLKRKG